MVTHRLRRHKGKGIYFLPNLLTTVSLFAGFYSIVAAMKGFYDMAALAIFIAMIADSLDGRVARMTHTQTAFGAEYDSLSDMLTFGVSPALIVYSWTLVQLGKFGWLTAFVYTAAAALRLARFNTQSSTDKRFFQGLPSPAAAGIIASTVWIGVNYELQGYFISILGCIITLLASALMVSNIRYHSFKDWNMKEKVPFVAIIAIVLILVGIAIAPPEMLFLVFFVYGASGPFITLMNLQKAKQIRKKHHPIGVVHEISRE